MRSFSTSSQMTPAVVATLKKAGVRYAFGYISIGEDDAPNPVNGNGEAIVPENRGIASFRPPGKSRP